LQSATEIGANVRSATESGANLQSATEIGTNLRSATESGANLQSATEIGANLQSATESGAILQSSAENGANFTPYLLRVLGKRSTKRKSHIHALAYLLNDACVQSDPWQHCSYCSLERLYF